MPWNKLLLQLFKFSLKLYILGFSDAAYARLNTVSSANGNVKLYAFKISSLVNERNQSFFMCPWASNGKCDI